MMRQITADETYAVTTNDGMIKIHASMMLVDVCYVVEHDGRTYRVRKNGDGSIDLSEVV